VEKWESVQLFIENFFLNQPTPKREIFPQKNLDISMSMDCGYMNKFSAF